MCQFKRMVVTSETLSVFRELEIFIKWKFLNAFVMGEGENCFKISRTKSNDQKSEKELCAKKGNEKCPRALTFISCGRKV